MITAVVLVVMMVSFSGAGDSPVHRFFHPEGGS